MKSFRAYLRENNGQIKNLSSIEFFHSLYPMGGGFPIKKYKDLQDRIKYFHWDDFNNEMYSAGLKDKIIRYFIYYQDNNIRGILKLQQDIETNSDILYITYLSVDPRYQKLGIASKLSEEAFKWCKENNKTLKPTLYSKIGFEKLKPLWYKLADKYNVNFIHREDML